jgi:hypothetical protein
MAHPLDRIATADGLPFDQFELERQAGVDWRTITIPSKPLTATCDRGSKPHRNM